MPRWRRGTDTTPEADGWWRGRLASRLLSAALYGAAEALEGRAVKEEPQVEEAPEPSGDDWLVLLDREDPSRSLVIVPQRVVAASAAAAGPGHTPDNRSLLASRGGTGA